MGGHVVDVFRFNLSQACREITSLIGRYPIVAIDTEFPGYFEDLSQLVRLSNISVPPDVLASPTDYQRLKINVDALSLIQLGISLSDFEGNTPQPHSTWQFNMLFDETTSIVNNDSLELLRGQGIDFSKLKRDGIHPAVLSYELQASGLLHNRSLVYLCFHGVYDFGYLVKTITMDDLPKSKREFNSLLRILFPGRLYDLKQCYSWIGSLESLADMQGVQRLGIQHQAGSDAWVTSSIFRSMIYVSGLPPHYMNRCIYGLTSSDEE